MSEDFKEEWFKLVLQEIRSNHDKLDEVNNNVSKIFTKAAQLEVTMEKIEEDVLQLSTITHGSEHGSNPGLTTKVSLLENKIATLMERQAELKNSQIIETKNRTSIKVAKIGAIGAGVIAFIKILADLFIM